MVRREPVSAQAYEHWLTREEVPIDAYSSKEAMADFLSKRRLRKGEFPLSERQVQALWDNSPTIRRWLEPGIRPYQFKSTIGTGQRYGIKGMRGSFGLQRAREIYQQRTGQLPPG